MSPANFGRTKWGLSRFSFDENGTVPLSRTLSRSILFALMALAVAVSVPRAYGAEAANVPSASRSVLVEGIPFIQQEPDFCGEACAAMYLQKLGRHVDQNYVFNQSGLDPLLGRGCYTRELAAALKKIGFQTGAVWYRIPAQGSDQAIQAQWQAVRTDLAAGVPTIVCMHYDDRPGTTEHFRLVAGYDAAADAVIYHEPAQAGGAYRRMSREKFLKLWPLAGGGGQSVVIRLRLQPGRLLPEPAPATSFTAADYAQHMMKLKKKIPGPEFNVVIEPPFVVLTDERPPAVPGDDNPPKSVRRHSQETVRWAVAKLKAAYFTKEPREILDIWLFKDDASYRSHCRSIFHNTPDTPYGYFSPTDKSLIMNISTGGGTLVHEIVHPFVATNFPHCPAWFNEGLGSLYEQCGEVNGRIHGYTNWRLPGLQKAIRNKHLPSFKKLCSTSDEEFYNEDRGTNYGQARYLCYYLQEHGLLGAFYRRFHAHRDQDPTGYETLKAVLGRDDMEAFQKEWEPWVMKLKYPDPAR